ncbi:cystathionine beta-synthase, partial [Glutamicibacter creatinolyticus]
AEALLAGTPARTPVGDLQTEALPLLGAGQSLEHAQALLQQHRAVLVTRDGEVLCPLTHDELLDHLIN